MNQNQSQQEIPSLWKAIKATTPAERVSFILQMLLATTALTMAAWVLYEKPFTSPVGDWITATLLAIFGMASWLSATIASFGWLSRQPTHSEAEQANKPEPE